MNLAGVALKDLGRRPMRTALSVLGISVAVVALVSVLAFDRGYDRALRDEMARSGTHLYVSTEGCPTEAASIVLHGGEIPRFLPQARLADVRRMPGVRTAAPFLILSAFDEQGAMDIFYGIDETILSLRRYWKIAGRLPNGEAEVMLGSETAKVERRQVGDKLFVPALAREFSVVGILDRTGTQDDGFYYLELPAMQKIFAKPGSLSAVAVGVEDLSRLGEAELRLKELPDVYVVTEKQMTEEILRLVGSSKAIAYALLIVALVVALVGVANTILTSVLERRREFGFLRCIGAGRGHILGLVLMESGGLSLAGGVLGVLLAIPLSAAVDAAVRGVLPYVPAGRLVEADPRAAILAMAVTLAVGVAAGVLPAFRAALVSPMDAVRDE